ncbi:MAG: hypothetical protein OER88_02355, partial [Planctomycetota bacterium]|nr:hypothetical protein [Planctomycetota bacterium]
SQRSYRGVHSHRHHSHRYSNYRYRSHYSHGHYRYGRRAYFYRRHGSHYGGSYCGSYYSSYPRYVSYRYRYGYRGYVRPYVRPLSLAPFVTRFATVLTLDDPVFDGASAAGASPAPMAGTGEAGGFDGVPHARAKPVGSRFLVDAS